MKAELEALVIALDNWKTARAGHDAERLEAIYESRIADVLERHPVTRNTPSCAP